MKFKATIRTLTPLHIGCGSILLKDYDFVSNSLEHKTYILNQDFIYMEEFEAKGAESRLHIPAGRLKTADQFKPGSPYILYDLDGVADVEQIHSFIKNYRLEPYLPGSSLKGAIRTALMSRGLEGLKADLRVDTASDLEKKIFGSNSNNDLLRALQIADSRPLSLDISPLVCLSAKVFTEGRKDSPIKVEAIREKVDLVTEIVIDELLLQYSEKTTGWKEIDWWLADFVGAVQNFSKQRIEQELKLARKKRWSKRENFFLRLNEAWEKMRLRGGTVLQLGWGTGWTGTTIGAQLPDGLKKEIRSRYNLGKPPRASKDWKPDLANAFPISRRLVEETEVPLGWVALSLEPVGEGGEIWHGLKAKAMHEKPMAAKPTAAAPESFFPKPQVLPSVPVSSQPDHIAKKPFITLFENLPNPGDQFIGSVLEVEKKGVVYIEIPGVDADEQGIGVISPEDTYSGNVPKEGNRIFCEVISVKPDPKNKGAVLVHCRQKAR